ncbi:MAG: permease, partial [Gemmataceae bacterium]
GLRVGLGFLVSVVTAHVVEWQYQKYGSKLLMPLAIPSELPSSTEEEDAPEVKRLAWQFFNIRALIRVLLTEWAKENRSAWQRLSNITETALHDFIDITVFLILGALLAAFTRQMITQDMIADLSRNHAVLSIGLMMMLAVLLCLCSEADAFVAASFSTLRPAAKLSFLVLGPMIDIKLYLMYTRVFRPRLIYTIFLTVTVQVLVYSYVTHVLWEYYAPQYMKAPASQSPPKKTAGLQRVPLAP